MVTVTVTVTMLLLPSFGRCEREPAHGGSLGSVDYSCWPAEEDGRGRWQSRSAWAVDEGALVALDDGRLMKRNWVCRQKAALEGADMNMSRTRKGAFRKQRSRRLKMADNIHASQMTGNLYLARP